MAADPMNKSYRNGIVAWVVVTLCVIWLALAAGCSGSGPTAVTAPSVNGTWHGGIGPGATLTTTLTQSAGGITGSGFASAAATGAILTTVSGTIAGSAVSLVITVRGYSPMNFTGTVSGALMSGALNGSGFTAYATTFTRDP